MPKGTPNAGFRRTKKRKKLTTQEIREELLYRTPDVLTELEKLVKPFPCPHCGNEVKIIDKDIGMWMVDHGIGRSTQRVEASITENIQLSGDDIDKLIERYKIATQPQLIEGVYEEL